MIKLDLSHAIKRNNDYNKIEIKSYFRFLIAGTEGNCKKEGTYCFENCVFIIHNYCILS